MTDHKIDNIVEVRKIVLPATGDVLEVEMTQAFINRVRQHFGLFGTQMPDDDHIRMFLWGSVNSAVEKAERGITGDDK